MRLLISTPLRLTLWDDGTPTVLHEGRQEDGNGNYTGITWDERTLYVACSLVFKYVIRTFDREFKETGWFANDLHETHQILWANDRLNVINTGKNRVETWGPGGWRWAAFNPSPCDVDHLNGVWYDGWRFWVTEFRHRPSKPSVVRVCDGDWKLLDTMAVGPPIHNVYVESGRMFNLVSRQFKGVLETEIATGRTEKHHVAGEADNLVRGLARTPDHWFVGLSRWEAERGDRHKGDAQVVVLDNSWREVDRIVLPDAGPTNDVRVLDEPDHAHNGVPW